MIQRALALMLQRLLGKFLSLDAAQLELSIWDGDLTFTDLQLHGRGKVGALQVQIPWRALWSQPVIVRAQHIRIFAHANSTNATSDAPTIVNDDPQDKTYLSKLLACIISNVQIELEDIEIRYECLEDSVEKTPGSVVCAIDRVVLQNTDGNWIPTFIDPAGGAKETRKRLQVHNISAYVVPYASFEDAPTAAPYYVFHNWSSDVKATLSYQSAGAAIPDVELGIVLHQSASAPTPCSTCRSVSVQPDVLTFHLESVHVDVLCAVLNEVQAPYDHFDKLTELTAATRNNQGFVAVLTYAKQWLLADVDAAMDLHAASADSDDDDDDLFQDAVSPPSLTLAVTIPSPVHLSIFPRSTSPDDEYNYTTDRLHWILAIDGTRVLWRQSCVETEVQVDIHAISLQECAAARGAVSLLHVARESDGPWLALVCRVPEYESRLVGAQPALRWRMTHAMHLIVSEASCWKWNELVSPVWQWWERWGALYPSKAAAAPPEPQLPALLPLVDVELRAITVELSIAEPQPFVLGCHVDAFAVTTVETALVTSTVQWDALRLYSTTAAEQHTMWACPATAIVLTSPTRAAWLPSQHLCAHTFVSGPVIPVAAAPDGFAAHFATTGPEESMYTLDMELPAVSLEVSQDEFRHVHVLLGKWTHGDHRAPSPQSSPHCAWVPQQYAQWAVTASVPSVLLTALDGNGVAWGRARLDGLCATSRSCSSLWQMALAVDAVAVTDAPTGQSILHLATATSVEFARCPRSGFAFSDKMTLRGLALDVVKLRAARIQAALYLPFLGTLVEWLAIGELHAALAAGPAPPPEPKASPATRTPRDTIHNTRQLHVALPQGFTLDLLYVPDGSDGTENAVRMSTLSSTHLTLSCFGYEPYCDVTMDVRGSAKELVLIDNSQPVVTDAAPLAHSRVIGASGDAPQHVDFRMHTAHADAASALATSTLQLRLDSVAIVYLHRVYKQLSHYLRDAVLPKLLWAPLSLQQRRAVHAWHDEEMDEDDGVPVAPEVLAEFHLEVVAHDLSLALPRNSFAPDALVLRSSSGSLTTVHAGVEPSVFVQSGLFLDEEDGPALDPLATPVRGPAAAPRLQELRRRELRNLRRLVKSQRAQLLVSRGQLLADHKTALRQKHHYMHQGGLDAESSAIVAQANQACAILSAKFDAVEENLASLQTHLAFLETEIEATRSVDEETVLQRVRNGRYRSRSIEDIEESVSNMPQYTVGSLFGAEDAAFHDATEAGPAEQLPWLAIELIGLSGATADGMMFEHAICSLAVDYKDQLKRVCDDTINYPILVINVLLNEWSIRMQELQYAAILGLIRENFKEVNGVVNEDTWPLCSECGGFHVESDGCDVEWLRVPVRVVDASLTLVKQLQAPEMTSTLRFEELQMLLTMRTSDVMDLHLCTEALSIVDAAGQEIVRPMQAFAEVAQPQVALHAQTNWTDGVYKVHVCRSHVLVVPASLQLISSFFAWPFWAESPAAELAFVAPPLFDWKLMEVHVVFDKKSCFYLLEDLAVATTRTLVLMAEVHFEYTMTQDVAARASATKMDLSVEQRGFYFSSLPDLHIDVDFPLMNPFTLQFMHLMQYVHGDTLDATQRNAVSLHADKSAAVVQPVEARLSIQDFMLLGNIFHTYSTASVADTRCGPELNYVEEQPRLLNDRLLADVGSMRVVLVNNSLGVPIADLVMSEIECQYEALLDEGASVSVGGILHCNYFNNSIYRWEPLVEPFEVQSISAMADTVQVKVNLPFTLNVNMTPAMAPLLSMEALHTMDAVTTGEKVTTPFWLQNSLGSAIKFSFAHGQSFIQKTVDHGQLVPIDCRDKSTHLRTFDKASEVDSLIYHKSNLTASHSLYVWVADTKWASVQPVAVDVVGNVAINMKRTDEAGEDALEPPVIVAEVSLQEDGSKLIHLHSQVLLRNETAMPLMLWGFSPPGLVEEWVVDRDATSYVPLHLIHPDARLSLRPSCDADYAPLASSFGVFETDIKSANVSFATAKRRFIKAGTCACKFKEATGLPQPLGRQLLPGFLVRDLPAWQCVYDVDAFVLLNTSMGGDRAKPNHRRLSTASSVPDDDCAVEEDVFSLFDDEPATPGAKNVVAIDVLEEAKHAKQGQTSGDPIFAHILTLKPYLTLHNRLASPVAYRVLAQSLQLVAEGILQVGDMLPLFQVNCAEDVFVSFRLENYRWSEPFNVVTAKTAIPFREAIDGITLKGRIFPDATTYKDTQGPVPELQLRLKRKDRDIVVYSALWIVNHTGLPLEYCDSMSRNPKTLEQAMTYLHARPGATLSTRFVPSASKRRSLLSPVSPVHQRARDEELRRFEKPALIVPVALYLVVQQAKELFNSHRYFGTQSPYVKASLYIPRQDAKTDSLVESLYCYATTRAVANGGTQPVFEVEHGNTLYLPFPKDTRLYQLPNASVIVEVHSSWLGADTTLGLVNIPLMDVLSRREFYAGFEWHPLVKRRVTRRATTATPGGQLLLSVSVATTHQMPSEDQPTWGTIATTPRGTSARVAPGVSARSLALPLEPFDLVVYLSTNRFASVTVSVQPSTLLVDVIQKVLALGGLSAGSVIVPSEYVFLELVLPRFVSLRSAGRPEGDRWYGAMLSDLDEPVRHVGRKYGVHLCHRSALNTLRLYDESSTASVHHSTPRALVLNRQQSFPAQARPVEWGEVINFGSRAGTASNWDVLRVRTSRCTWSEPVRIHRNAMGNSGVAQQITLVEAGATSRKQYELALWSAYGTGAFADTIVTTIVPRYVLINRTSFPLWFRQHECNVVSTLPLQALQAYHWDKADAPKKSLQVTFASNAMEWSGPFALHSLGTTYLKLRGKDDPHSIYILQAQLELVGGSIVCVFCDESKRWPPYRIDNFTSFRLHFHQAMWGEDVWDEVGPRSSVPYSWDSHEGSLSVSADGGQTHVLERFLEVRFMQVQSSLSSVDASNAIVDTKEYNLDAMQKHKRLQLTRSLPASLFNGGCAREGVLLKKDNAFNWSKRYFRVHEHMVYYFLTDTDHALRGVIDLGLGSSIAVKGWAKAAPRKSATASLNPLRAMSKSISDTLFGEEQSSDPFMNIALKMQSVEFAVWLATLLRRTSWLEAKARDWLGALAATDLTPTQLFLAAGRDIVQLILDEDLAPSRNHAGATAQHLLQCGMLMVWNPPPDMDVDNIVFEDADVLYRVSIPTPPPTPTTSFTLLTPAKSYSLRTESPEETREWCVALRQAIVLAMDAVHEAQRRRHEKARPKDDKAGATTKTYVHARVRADGPTKVLELTEGGEEDDDGLPKDAASLRAPEDSALVPTPAVSLFQHVTVQCTLHSVGLSCVNATPMEVLYVSLQGLTCQFHRHETKMRFAITVRDIQADNQVPDATFTTMLCPKEIPATDDGPSSFHCDDCRAEHPSAAVAFHFCCGWSNEQGSTDYFEYCSFHLLPMMLQLDEELVSVLRTFLMQVIYQQQGAGQKYLNTTAMDVAPLLTARQVASDFKTCMESSELDPLHNVALLESATTSTSSERKVYFALLHIHPVELDLTFRSDIISGTRMLQNSVSTVRTETVEHSTTDEDGNHVPETVAAWIPSLSMHVPDLDNAPIRLNALIVEHAFGTSGEVTRRVTKYYTRQLWKQVHKVLGSFDFLGNPAGLLDHLGTAVRDLIVEPIQGARTGTGITGTGVGFGKGLAKGATSFVTNFIDGTSDATSKVTGTFGQGLATMSFDDHYQQARAKARRRHVRGFKEGIIQGSRELTLGMVEGVTGVVLNPIRGAQTDGAVGFLKGTVTGLLGLPMKPVAGVFDFASRATQGIRNRSLAYGRQGLRVRLPRVFGRYNELRCYKEEDVAAHLLVSKTGTDEKIIFHARLEQHVAADQLARKAKLAQQTPPFLPLHRHVLRMERFESDTADADAGAKATYAVVFAKKALGLELETDFYNESVVIKNCLDRSSVQSATTASRDVTQKLLQPGDVIVQIGDVDVRRIGFRETIDLIKGAARPVTITFESAEVIVAPSGDSSDDGSPRDKMFVYSPSTRSMPPTPSVYSKLKVTQVHWVIITDTRVLYVQWAPEASHADAVLEWSAPLQYIHDVDATTDAIRLHLRVGVNSLFTGPLTRPAWRHETLQAVEAMKTFGSVMRQSFRSETADVQEVYPSDTSFSGHLRVGFGTGNKRRRWCVLCRNCLYLFTPHSPRVLKYIIPLGRIALEKDAAPLAWTLKGLLPHEALHFCSVDGPVVGQRMDMHVHLAAEKADDVEMWMSALTHAAGKGLRHSKGTRFYAPSDATTLSIGCHEAKPHVVHGLADALRKTLAVFKA
ncbi:vacuolar protein sorting-associated protein [Achlya hypogyna]|uniref:Vacuolar protein sorting-associated protein n=1 Tax=Achlya hypogyna TaxID=1202772 RepID=A0A1V9YH36_ACHHY|nr:vacuolar protein sorting-associated protein [Achlya hypogyna]